MDTKEVEKYLKKDKFAKIYFKKVLPIDMFNVNDLKKNTAFIINTDPSNLPGEHWIALFRSNRGTIEYFDSFGLPPINESLKKLNMSNRNNFIFNKQKIQSFDSNNCGKYAIFYIYLRSRNIPLYKINKFYFKNKLYNDRFIKYLFNKYNKFFNK